MCLMALYGLVFDLLDGTVVLNLTRNLGRPRRTPLGFMGISHGSIHGAVELECLGARKGLSQAAPLFRVCADVVSIKRVFGGATTMANTTRTELARCFGSKNTTTSRAQGTLDHLEVMGAGNDEAVDVQASTRIIGVFHWVGQTQGYCEPQIGETGFAQRGVDALHDVGHRV